MNLAVLDQAPAKFSLDHAGVEGKLLTDSHSFFRAGTTERDWQKSPENSLYVSVVAGDATGENNAADASYLAIQTIERVMQQQSADMPVVQRIGEALRTAHQTLLEVSERTIEQRGVGTAVVMAVIEGWRLYVAHLGDCRVYLVRDGLLHRLTIDHTSLQEAIDTHTINENEATLYANRQVPLRFLGMTKGIQVDHGILAPGSNLAIEQRQIATCVELQPGDVVMLSSNGLTDKITDSELCEVFRQHRPKQVVRALVAKALERREEDNITVALLVLPQDNGNNRLTLRGLDARLLLFAAMAAFLILAVSAWAGSTLGQLAGWSRVEASVLPMDAQVPTAVALFPTSIITATIRPVITGTSVSIQQIAENPKPAMAAVAILTATEPVKIAAVSTYTATIQTAIIQSDSEKSDSEKNNNSKKLAGAKIVANASQTKVPTATVVPVATSIVTNSQLTTGSQLTITVAATNSLQSISPVQSVEFSSSITATPGIRSALLSIITPSETTLGETTLSVILPSSTPTVKATATVSLSVTQGLTASEALTITSFITTTVPAPATVAPAPTPTQTESPNLTVALLEPLESTLAGRYTFRWQPNFELAANRAFELVFWKFGEDPLRNGFSPIGIARASDVRVDLNIAARGELASSLLSGNTYQWGVLLVEAAQNHRRLQVLTDGHPFLFKLEESEAQSTPEVQSTTTVAQPVNTATQAPPAETPIPPPTNTKVPELPTDTPIPPTDTPILPTDTPILPTDTPIPPTDTPIPPTDTPEPPPTPTEECPRTDPDCNL